MGEPQGTPDSPTALPSGTAEKLLRLDLLNIAGRAKSGKRLTSAERNLLQSLAIGSQPGIRSHVTTWEALATEIGCTKRALLKWRKEPGAPSVDTAGRHDVAAWRAWVQAAGKKFKGQEEAVGDSTTDAAEKRRREIEKLDLQNELLRVEVARAKGEVIGIEEAARISGAGAAAARSKLQALPRAVAPSLVGLSASEIAAHLAAQIATILTELSLSPWLPTGEPEAEQ